MPQALAAVHRRRSSCMRSSLRATSIPPLWVNTPSAWYCSVLSRVSSIIIFEYSIGKMKLEACPVEPPGFGIGPLSTSTRSRQPSSAKWWTRLLPTMPAPITTALARGGDPPEPPDDSRPRSFVTGPWPLALAGVCVMPLLPTHLSCHCPISPAPPGTDTAPPPDCWRRGRCHAERDDATSLLDRNLLV